MTKNEAVLVNQIYLIFKRGCPKRVPSESTTWPYLRRKPSASVICHWKRCPKDASGSLHLYRPQTFVAYIGLPVDDWQYPKNHIGYLPELRRHERRWTMNSLSDYLGYWMKRFFNEYITSVRNLSRNTLKSYHDTFRLFVKHIHSENRIPPEKTVYLRNHQRESCILP